MSRKEWIIIFAIVFIGGAAVSTHLYKSKHQNGQTGNEHGHMAASETNTTYKLGLISGKTYAAASPVSLRFTIKDTDDKAITAFDTVHEKKLHLIVVRKDRTNFQHVHPVLDEKTGSFSLSNFSFPTDGEYRIFAESTPSESVKSSSGNKPASVVYQDVKIGDASQYSPASLGDDKLSSSANGFDTTLDIASDSPSTDYIANATTNLAVSFSKDSSLYKDLQTYLGALGHMVVLGPKLEYIHAHALSENVANQTGVVKFAVGFKDAGQYKIYLQTQADGTVNTTDYTVTAQPSLQSHSSSNHDSMQSTDHMSH